MNITPHWTWATFRGHFHVNRGKMELLAASFISFSSPKPWRGKTQTDDKPEFVEILTFEGDDSIERVTVNYLIIANWNKGEKCTYENIFFYWYLDS